MYDRADRREQIANRMRQGHDALADRARANQKIVAVRMADAIADRHGLDADQKAKALQAIIDAPPAIYHDDGMMTPVDLYGRALLAAGIDLASVGWTMKEVR